MISLFKDFVTRFIQLFSQNCLFKKIKPDPNTCHYFHNYNCMNETPLLDFQRSFLHFENNGNPLKILPTKFVLKLQILYFTKYGQFCRSIFWELCLQRRNNVMYEKWNPLTVHFFKKSVQKSGELHFTKTE